MCSVDLQWAEKILSRRGFLQAFLVEVAAAELGDLQPPNLGAEKGASQGVLLLSRMLVSH